MTAPWAMAAGAFALAVVLVDFRLWLLSAFTDALLLAGLAYCLLKWHEKGKHNAAEEED